jgi:hypothetical protein
MATSESDFKREFREALNHAYGSSAVIWTNNDMFRAGLPDFSAHYNSRFYAIEAKYVKEPPVRATSKVLGHELSAIQAEFLQNIQRTGGCGVVLIGFSDIAVAVPFSEWAVTHGIPDTNITLERVRLLGRRPLGFPKVKGKWNVTGFFDLVQEASIKEPFQHE